MKTHVFNTWLVANGFFPLVFICVALFDHASGNSGFLGGLIAFFGLALIFSLPSLVISWLLMALIRKLAIKNTYKYITWLLSVSLVPVVNFFIIYFVLLKEIPDPGDYEMVFSAVIAVFLTVLIRKKHFFDQLNNTPQHETNMV